MRWFIEVTPPHSLRFVPKLVRDDPQFWGLDTHPFSLGIYAGNAFASLGISQHSLAIMDELSRVKFVLQDPVTSAAMAVDC